MKWTMLIEGFWVLVGLWLVVTQIVMPGFRGRPFFPYLRAPKREADAGLAKAMEYQDITQTRRAAKEARTFKGE